MTRHIALAAALLFALACLWADTARGQVRVAPPPTVPPGPVIGPGPGVGSPGIGPVGPTIPLPKPVLVQPTLPLPPVPRPIGSEDESPRPSPEPRPSVPPPPETPAVHLPPISPDPDLRDQTGAPGGSPSRDGPSRQDEGSGSGWIWIAVVLGLVGLWLVVRRR